MDSPIPMVESKQNENYSLKFWIKQLDLFWDGRRELSIVSFDGSCQGNV